MPVCILTVKEIHLESVTSIRKQRNSYYLAMFKHVPQSPCVRSLVLNGIVLGCGDLPCYKGCAFKDGQMLVLCGLA